MLISLALSFARAGNGQRATSWVTVARTLAPPVISSLTCAFFHTLLLETLILLYQVKLEYLVGGFLKYYFLKFFFLLILIINFIALVA